MLFSNGVQAPRTANLPHLSVSGVGAFIPSSPFAQNHCQALAGHRPQLALKQSIDQFMRTPSSRGDFRLKATADDAVVDNTPDHTPEPQQTIDELLSHLGVNHLLLTQDQLTNIFKQDPTAGIFVNTGKQQIGSVSYTHLTLPTKA